MSFFVGISQFSDFGKNCLNINDGWLKTWGGLPAYLLTSIPVISSLFVSVKAQQVELLVKAEFLRKNGHSFGEIRKKIDQFESFAKVANKMLYVELFVAVFGVAYLVERVKFKGGSIAIDTALALSLVVIPTSILKTIIVLGDIKLNAGKTLQSRNGLTLISCEYRPEDLDRAREIANRSGLNPSW